MKQFAPHVVDIYKVKHPDMYTEGTDFLYSNFTPRSDKYFKGGRLYDGKLVVFGAQGALRELVELWTESFFNQPKSKVVARYKRRMDKALGVGAVSPDRIAALHDIGYLPLEIRTIDEGSRIGMKIPMLTIKNTIPEFFWLVNYLETALSALIWKGSTNATIAYEYKRLCTDYAVRTGSAIETVMFQCHDFSMRGMPGIEDSARSGSGHLTSSYGTDTIGAIDYIEDYYDVGLDLDTYFIAGSVAATEHAVSSSNILTRAKLIQERHPSMSKDEVLLRAEIGFMFHYITQTVPTGIASYVADTYNYWGVLTKVLPVLKDEIMARAGKLVIRPDSGDPVQIICGMSPVRGEDGKAINFESEDAAYDWLDVGDRVREQLNSDCIKIGGVFYDYSSTVYDDYTEGCGIDMDVVYPYEVVAGSIRTLWSIFGGTVNTKGFKELDSHIGLIYGDSITLERADTILKRLEEAGFASSNVVFGVGSYTYQMSSRDTFGNAVKATATSVNGEFFEIYKDPATGDKLKKSAKGLLYVGRDENGEFYSEDQVSKEKEQTGELKVRFKDGQWSNLTNIEVIRQRLK
jgi:nicotinamide phosphoribosyltransferase